MDNEKIPFNSSQLKSLLDLNPNSDLVLQNTEQDKTRLYFIIAIIKPIKNIPVEKQYVHRAYKNMVN